jgi:CheY-like chemotaxis protein
LAPSSPVCRLFILIVQNQDDAQRLALPLRALGHEVFVARSEEQAERTLLVHPCEVILIDTDLGGGDGRGAAKRLCGPMRVRPMMVAIIPPGHAGERRTPEGFDHHIGKPVDSADLIELLRKHPGRTRPGMPAAEQFK